MSRILTYSGILGALAECLDCGWTTECRENALANAKRHSTAYNHTVRCEQTIGVTYTPEDSDYNKAKGSK